ncbi:DR2241 family protein [Candidatus Halobonum tyrrellensis]|uniref:Uncharacterized protein n=1 Tax=Candidatus Halobonum tyrrellensis G22 TaxID=1324957 RepID=V4HND8_9EURY|nr:DR2241 family protein [Candidatus Halobonum tyrrellensis]ESP89434.1 hypothetical protein K933_04016 [Candidatus Halobonum tyrrellensis G22]
MLDRHADALVRAAGEGVDFDGLRVSSTPDGYRFETPETTAEGLSEADLRGRADDPYVTNWYFWEREVGGHGRPRRAFLRRAEDAPIHSTDDPDPEEDAGRAVPDRYAALRGSAEAGGDGGEADEADAVDGDGHGAGGDGGLVTEWGQLRIEATLGEGDARRYDLRHVDDADARAADLDSHDDPLDAREVGKLDGRERYRPLKTAPSLRRGWVFPSLDPRALTEAVEAFYPATVANWYREYEGELDVDHWVDTAERQTGIYDVIDELPREGVEYVAEACCVDSQCLRRREWEYDEGDDLAADGGDGPFPCREPCSLVVAAARKWTKLEAEEEREYTFTLTPSEREQVEDIVGAVADGRAAEIREADLSEGANRYRARYLRAKRFADGESDAGDGDTDDATE